MFTFLICLANAMSLILSGPSHSHLSDAIGTPQCSQWVDSVYNSLNERQRAGQLIVAHVLPSDASAKAAVDAGVGGLLFSKGSMADYASVTNYAQSIAKTPLLMTLDGEWGLAMRMSDAPLYPVNMALGAISDPEVMYAYGQEVARQCRAMGIHVNFAPVLDVNSNPENPVIGQRSLGEDPERVAKLGRAYSLGLESGGVMAVAKHFPGHGDTNADSHKALPVIDRTRDTLTQVDLFPFRKFIGAGCNGVMVGHISVPALDASGRAASMSPAITTGLLRDNMRFNGLIFTDGLGMAGANVDGNRCVAALKAGADVLLGAPSPAKDIDAILKAVKDGELPAQLVEERCKKVLAYKYALGLNDLKPIDESSAMAIVSGPQAEAVNTRLADASVTVIRNDGDILPIKNLDKNTIAIVNIGQGGSTEFDQMCQRYAKCDVYDGAALTPSTLAEIKAHSIVVAAVHADSQQSRAALAQLSGTPGLVSVFLTNPYKMAKYKSSLDKAQAIVAVFDNTPHTQRAAAKAVFGGIKVDGRMPVNVNGIAELGKGITLDKTRLGYSTLGNADIDPALEARIDSVMNNAMARGAFPGAQVLVARNGDVVLDRCYGLTTAGGSKVTPYTLYDLASVSKTVGTLPGVMKCYDLGMFDLDTPASKIIPGLDVEGKRDITPRMMLYHETGIRPSLNLYDIMMDPATYEGSVITSKRDKKHTIKIYNNCWGHKSAKMRKDIASRKPTDNLNIPAAKDLYVGKATYDTIMARIYNSPLCDDRSYRYSCLNFCLLMDMEQRLTGQPHEQWVADSIWGPIGAYTFCYRAADKYPLSQIAATENDVYLRKQHVRGYVHDELCAFSGGIQGNAGVFGTATDVAKLCQTWLNGGKYGDKHLFSPATTRLFTTDKTPNSRRGLGFDKPDMVNPDNSPCCDEAGPEVYGHTGFTGTCYWVDPEYGLIYVFLANRVDPTRSNSAWTECSARSTIMSMLYNSILDK